MHGMFAGTTNCLHFGESGMVRRWEGFASKKHWLTILFHLEHSSKSTAAVTQEIAEHTDQSCLKSQKVNFARQE